MDDEAGVNKSALGKKRGPAPSAAGGGGAAAAGGLINPAEERELLTDAIEEAKLKLTKVFADESKAHADKTELIKTLSEKMSKLIDQYDRVSEGRGWFDFSKAEQDATLELTNVSLELQRDIQMNQKSNATEIEKFKRVNPKFLKLWRAAQLQTAAYHDCVKHASRTYDLLPLDERRQFEQLISEPLKNAVSTVTFRSAAEMVRAFPGISREEVSARYARLCHHTGKPLDACHALYTVINMFYKRVDNQELRVETVRLLCLAYVESKVKELDSLFSAAGLMYQTADFSDIPIFLRSMAKLFFLNASLDMISSLLPDLAFARILSNDMFQVLKRVSPLALLPYASKQSVTKIGNSIGTLGRVLLGYTPIQEVPPPGAQGVGGGAQPPPGLPTVNPLVSDLLDTLINEKEDQVDRRLMGQGAVVMPQSPFDFMALVSNIQYIFRWFGVGSARALRDGLSNIHDLFNVAEAFIKHQPTKSKNDFKNKMWDIALERAGKRGTISPIDDLFYRRLLDELLNILPEGEINPALLEILQTVDRTQISVLNLQAFTANNLLQYPEDAFRYVSPDDDASIRAHAGQSESSQVLAAQVINDANGFVEPPDTNGESRTAYTLDAAGGFFSMPALPPLAPGRGWGAFDWGPENAAKAALAAAKSAVPAQHTRAKTTQKNKEEEEAEKLAKYAAQFGKPQGGGKAHTYKRSTSKHTKHKKSSGLKQKSKKNKRQSRRKVRHASSRKGRK